MAADGAALTDELSPVASAAEARSRAENLDRTAELERQLGGRGGEGRWHRG